jgi:cytochrome c oxidase cbb3-type subunit III
MISLSLLRRASSGLVRRFKEIFAMTSSLRSAGLGALCLATAVILGLPTLGAQNPAGPRPAGRVPTTVGSQGPLPEHAKFTGTQIDSGGVLFLQNCAFCHGKDAGGGESGPDLTRSKLVSGDKEGEAIGVVIRNGRLDKGMPKFNLPDTDTIDLVAFIHSQQDKAMSQSGNRKGVDPSDLLTGNVEAGKKYFEGAGGCSKCHSETSLAGVATRNVGLRLEQQMLYPRGIKSKVTVTTKAGETFAGTLDYRDEFTIGMTDSTGAKHTWPADTITKVEDPLEAHVDAFSKYTDADIHNLFAYIQTLK